MSEGITIFSTSNEAPRFETMAITLFPSRTAGSRAYKGKAVKFDNKLANYYFANIRMRIRLRFALKIKTQFSP